MKEAAVIGASGDHDAGLARDARPANARWR